MSGPSCVHCGGDCKPLPKAMEDLAGMFCGCVTRESTWGVILAELERLDRAEFKANDDLAASVVDWCKLSEHGTSIRGGWLTDAGKEVLAFLRTYGIDWDKKGQFVDAEGCHWGLV